MGHATNRSRGTPNDVFLLGEEPHGATIDLARPNSRWPDQFDREAARVRALLGAEVVQLEHVGSTAVPGLSAKPIIDILLVVADPADEPAYVPALESGGYVLKIREADWFEHRLFKGPDTNINLHVFPPDSPEVRRMLLFRDWLRTGADDRELYEQTKQRLAAQTWDYVQDYAEAKTMVVEEILGRAFAAEPL